MLCDVGNSAVGELSMKVCVVVHLMYASRYYVFVRMHMCACVLVHAIISVDL